MRGGRKIGRKEGKGIGEEGLREEWKLGRKGGKEKLYVSCLSTMT